MFSIWTSEVWYNQHFPEINYYRCNFLVLQVGFTFRAQSLNKSSTCNRIVTMCTILECIFGCIFIYLVFGISADYLEAFRKIPIIPNDVLIPGIFSLSSLNNGQSERAPGSHLGMRSRWKLSSKIPLYPLVIMEGFILELNKTLASFGKGAAKGKEVV